LVLHIEKCNLAGSHFSLTSEDAGDLISSSNASGGAAILSGFQSLQEIGFLSAAIPAFGFHPFPHLGVSLASFFKKIEKQFNWVGGNRSAKTSISSLSGRAGFSIDRKQRLRASQ